MDYQVRFISDRELPEGVPWAFARQAGVTYLFVKRSAVNPITLTRAWEAWQEVEAESVRRGLNALTVAASA